jgi:hypothetical protein
MMRDSRVFGSRKCRPSSLVTFERHIRCMSSAARVRVATVGGAEQFNGRCCVLSRINSAAAEPRHAFVADAAVSPFETTHRTDQHTRAAQSALREGVLDVNFRNWQTLQRTTPFPAMSGFP